MLYKRVKRNVSVDLGWRVCATYLEEMIEIAPSDLQSYNITGTIESLKLLMIKRLTECRWVSL